MSTLDYVRRDVIGGLFAIQFLVLALKGKAWFITGTAKPRFSATTAKSMGGKYFWAVAAAAVLAGVVWDLHRKFPR